MWGKKSTFTTLRNGQQHQLIDCIMRHKIVAANWKMNQTAETAHELLSALATAWPLLEKTRGLKAVICPPFLLIPACVEALRGLNGIYTGAQNCHSEAKGAFTGEISAPMLAASGATYVIIGHSERRMYFHEYSEFLMKKIQACLAHGLTPIFCCGEVLAEREAGNHKEVVQQQITEALFGFTEAEMQRIIIAYEPVWAIGTGLTASPAQAQEMHHHIRWIIESQFTKEIADTIPILYGGSCNAANAAELFSQADVDGGLIGGASLKATDFISILKSAIETSTL
jgi:triosephosphate isomerase